VPDKKERAAARRGATHFSRPSSPFVVSALLFPASSSRGWKEEKNQRAGLRGWLGAKEAALVYREGESRSTEGKERERDSERRKTRLRSQKSTSEWQKGVIEEIEGKFQLCAFSGESRGRSSLFFFFPLSLPLFFVATTSEHSTDLQSGISEVPMVERWKSPTVFHSRSGGERGNVAKLRSAGVRSGFVSRRISSLPRARSPLTRGKDFFFARGMRDIRD